MSEVRKRPVVSCAQCAMVSHQSCIQSQPVMQAAVAQLNPAARAVYQQAISAQSRSETLQSAHAVYQATQVLQTQIHQSTLSAQLTTEERCRIQALAVSHLCVASPQNELVLSPDTLPTSPRELDTFTEELIRNHQKVFVDQIALACNRAASRLGFQPEAPSLSSSGHMRVIATNSQGRTLITEIGMDPKQPTSMATEIIGMSDASCDGILNAFDKALEEEGIYSGPPERRFTGGICELEAAREFLQRQIRPKPIAETQSKRVAQPQRRKIRPQRQKH